MAHDKIMMKRQGNQEPIPLSFLIACVLMFVCFGIIIALS